MKIAALIDWVTGGVSGIPDGSFIKRQTGADALIVLTSGEFNQEGEVSEPEKYKRAELIREKGGDLVLELPVYCTLTTMDTFAFAAVSMLEKLNCVDSLAIFIEDTDEKTISQIVRLLFVEPAEYQAELKKLTGKGVSFEKAQAEAAGKFVPGAEKVLLNKRNRTAVEYMKAAKRMYSTMKVQLLKRESMEERNSHVQACRAENKEKTAEKIGEELRNKIEEISPQYRQKYFDEISGGFAPKTSRLLWLYEFEGIKNFNDFSEKLADGKRPVNDIKRYLLRSILGIRQVDISVCGLRSYAVYARILGNYEKSGLFETVQSSAWIPVFDDRKGFVSSNLKKFDDSEKLLLKIDRRADTLYRKIHSFTEMKE